MKLTLRVRRSRVLRNVCGDVSCAARAVPELSPELLYDFLKLLHLVRCTTRTSVMERTVLPRNTQLASATLSRLVRKGSLASRVGRPGDLLSFR